MDKMYWRLCVIFGVLHVVSAGYYENAKNARSGALNSIDSNVRPSQLVEVNVGFSLLAITRMVSDENLMSAVGWFTVTWLDTFFIWDSSQSSFLDVTSLHYKEGEIWRPELRVENAVHEVDIIASEHHRFRVLENGTVIWQPATQMDVHCSQDLTYYPFDKQKCSITLTSWSHDVSEVILRSSRTTVDLSHFVENAEWTLDEETTVVLSNQTSTSGGITTENSRITYYITLSRISNLVGLTFLFPLLLLSLLTMLVFLLPVASGEKATYCAVVMLSVIVFFTSAIEYFPVSKAVPVRVTYIIIVLVLACLSVLFTFVVMWLYHQKAEKPMSRGVVELLKFLNTITCSGDTFIESRNDTKTIEIHPNTSSSTEHPKQLSPIQNGGGHLTAVPSGHSLETMEKLPPVNDHLRKNKVRPKSGESVYSVSKRKGRQAVSCNTNNWQNLAERLDSFLFVLFVILTILVHFIFLVTLAAGGKASDP